MAFMIGVLQITGKLDTLVAYKVPGIDRVIVRPKGMLNKHKIKTHPSFETTRLLNTEFSACVMMATNIRRAMDVMMMKADYNYTGKLNGICKKIQTDDTVNERGKRSVLLSRSVQKLDGFGFNKFNTFDSILRTPLDISIDRNTGTAGIKIPSIVPGLQLNNPRKQPFYRFCFTLSTVADIVYNDQKFEKYDPVVEERFTSEENTPWYNWKQGSPETTIHLALDNWQPMEGVSILLGGAIEFGEPISDTKIQYVKYSGAGKILRVV